jgi:outer membrane immunogenic protein
MLQLYIIQIGTFRDPHEYAIHGLQRLFSLRIISLCLAHSFGLDGFDELSQRGKSMHSILKLTVAAGLGLALGQAASAADLPRKAPVMPMPVAAGYDWSGFYIGAHVGAGWSQHEVSADELLGLVVASPQASGFLGGGQIGFNVQSGSFVWGVEVDGSWADIKGKSQLYIPLEDGLIGNTEAKIQWLTTATARVGFAFDRTMVYVKGGAAWAKFEYNSAGALDTGDGLVPASSSGSTDKWGWTIGAGVEHAFSANWSAKLEYNYVQFDTDNMSIDYSINGSPTASYDLVSSRENVHMVKFGLNYKFSPWSSPVSARY